MFPIYLLSKEGENPRRQPAIERIISQFRQSPGVIDGPDWHREGWEKRSWPMIDGCHGSFHFGQHCCLTGHMTILIRFLATGSPVAMICEDDVEFRAPAEAFDAAVATANARYGDKWAWMNTLGWECGHVVVFPDGHQNQWSAGGIHRADKAAFVTACYLITHHGAIALLNRATPHATVIDHYTRDSGSDIVLQAGPSLSGTREGPSLILN